MRLTLPPPVPEPDAPPFPLAGVLAPLLAASVLFALTRSPLSLAFAALSPVLAVAAVWDGRRGRRRAGRRASTRRAAALDALARAVAEEQGRRRTALQAGAPRAADIAAAPPAPTADGPVPVVLGRGRLPSGIDLGDPGEGEGDRRLAAAAAVLHDAPVVADARYGIGVAGPHVLTEAVLRGLAVQARWRGADPRRVRFAGADRVDALGVHCEAVLEVTAPGRAVLVRHPDPALQGPLRPELVSRATAAPARRRTAADLDGLGAATGSGALPALFLTRDGRPRELDLAADGPHAVVGGTTGSGKSELLTAWALALARASPPDRVALLLLDFKGGTAFDHLAHLPHVAGVVTDLDPAEAARAAEGLSAELRRREEALRTAGLRSVDGSGLPRLVVLIDEVQALLEGWPALGAVLTDIASRGRALGVHLVLGGQRPAGVLREALLANCGLRLSLRVLDPADSSAVVGTPDAARLPADAPGTVLVARSGEPPVEYRVARVGSVQVPSGQRASPVWLPALAPPLQLTQVGAGVAVLGRVDRPAEQTQPVAGWLPAADGALLISGARGSGRTGALAAVAASLPDALVVPGAAADGGERLWDALTGGGEPLLLVDDADLALAGLGEHAPDAAELLSARIRRGRVAVVVRGQPPHGLRAAAFGRTLVLGCAKEDAALLGVEPARWSARRHPGGGWLDGEVFQTATAPPLCTPAAPVPPQWTGAESAVVVSSRPAARLASLRAVVGRPVVDLRGQTELPPGGIGVIDPECWQGRPVLWSLPGTLPLLFEGCTLGEYRAVSRRRTLPPALAPGRAWRLPADGPTERVILAE